MGALANAADDRSNVIVSRNPLTGEVLGEVPDMSAADVQAAVARARAAQPAWGALSVRERADAILKVRDLLVSRAAEVCQLLSREAGKTELEALSMEVVVIADLMTYFAKRAPRILAPEPISLHLLKHRASYLHYVPRGVVAVIAPWNFPFGIPVGEAVMALIAGNAVVLKPSEMTPLIAVKTRELFEAAGLPRDLLQVVTGRGQAGAALIDAGVDYVSFTGSTATGKKVAVACGERLIPCTLELGGKAPAIVCADADVERTARALVWGAFANQGQVCVSVERVYAHDAVHDELVERVLHHTKQLRLEPGQDVADVGAMCWQRQVEIVEERIRTAVDHGAKLRSGGERSGRGLQFQPTVITDCRQDMDVMRKEIFGPVMPIMRVRDETEALRLANDSHLGLAAYIFTQDRAKGRRLAERIEAGMVMINDCLLTFGAPETPWMGIKQSGIGRTHSDDGLRNLCQTRHVNYDRISFSRELWWYPYSGRVYNTVLKAMRVLFR